MALRSGIAWLSSSTAEIARARSVLDALRKPGVIDELGFLMLNAAFAERFYPGVTTIMTRARYFIFVPAIYRYLEHSRKAVGKDADRVARDFQFDLRNALERNETSFIGKESGRDLVRTPSAVYWSALSALGIANRYMSEASYQRQLSDGAFSSRGQKDDDGAIHDEEAESMWVEALATTHVLPNGKFPHTTSFRLEKREATFLESRYAALVQDGNEPLVTTMVRLGRQHGPASLEDIEYPWLIPGVSGPMEGLLDHARRLSLLARGATFQYYRMIIEKRRDEDGGVTDAFAKWWDQARSELASWNVQAFFGLMTQWQAGRGAKDRDFISGWIGRIQAARTPRAALDDQTARALIVQRENYVRPGKQRLRVKHQLETWRLPNGATTGVYQMDYRHRVGRQIAKDVADGLLRGTA